MNDGNAYEVTDEWIRDEYKNYTKSIYKLIQNNSDISKIAKQLHQHITVNMGISKVDMKNQILIAKKLKDIM